MTAPDRQESLRALYRAFNARDVDTVLAAMAPDVDWPNGWQGGRVVGHDAVRRYCARQWAEIRPRVEPTGIRERPDGTVDRKSTRLNSSHANISYAVFCL